MRDKIEAAHAALALPQAKGMTGRPPGALSWFRDQVEERTGWRPGTTTLHRWVSGDVEDPRPELAETLESLQGDARIARRLEASAREFRR